MAGGGQRKNALLELQQLTRTLTDVQAAEELNEARQTLFKRANTGNG